VGKSVPWRASNNVSAKRQRLGFEKIFVSRYNNENFPKALSAGMEILYVSKVEDVFSGLLV
jgi:hypothetical protein